MTCRVGLLIPSSNAVIEVDLYRNLPRDTTLHASRIHAADLAPDGDGELPEPLVISAAAALAPVYPQIVVFDGAVAGLNAGDGWREREGHLAGRIREATGSLAIGVSAAVFEALSDARAVRIAVVTPYTGEVNRRIKATIEAEGFEVTAIHGMGLSTLESGAVTSDAVYAFVQSAIGVRAGGDALLLAGTNFQALGALSLLRISYDVPVVTSNLAALQAVGREIHRLRQRELARLSS